MWSEITPVHLLLPLVRTQIANLSHELLSAFIAFATKHNRLKSARDHWGLAASLRRLRQAASLGPVAGRQWVRRRLGGAWNRWKADGAARAASRELSVRRRRTTEAHARSTAAAWLSRAWALLRAHHHRRRATAAAATHWRLRSLRQCWARAREAAAPRPRAPRVAPCWPRAALRTAAVRWRWRAASMQRALVHTGPRSGLAAWRRAARRAAQERDSLRRAAAHSGRAGAALWPPTERLRRGFGVWRTELVVSAAMHVRRIQGIVKPRGWCQLKCAESDGIVHITHRDFVPALEAAWRVLRYAASHPAEAAWFEKLSRYNHPSWDLDAEPCHNQCANRRSAAGSPGKGSSTRPRASKRASGGQGGDATAAVGDRAAEFTTNASALVAGCPRGTRQLPSEAVACPDCGKRFCCPQCLHADHEIRGGCLLCGMSEPAASLPVVQLTVLTLVSCVAKGLRDVAPVELALATAVNTIDRVHQMQNRYCGVHNSGNLLPCLQSVKHVRCYLELIDGALRHPNRYFRSVCLDWGSVRGGDAASPPSPPRVLTDSRDGFGYIDNRMLSIVHRHVHGGEVHAWRADELHAACSCNGNLHNLLCLAAKQCMGPLVSWPSSKTPQAAQQGLRHMDPKLASAHRALFVKQRVSRSLHDTVQAVLAHASADTSAAQLDRGLSVCLAMRIDGIFDTDDAVSCLSLPAIAGTCRTVLRGTLQLSKESINRILAYCFALPRFRVKHPAGPLCRRWQPAPAVTGCLRRWRARAGEPYGCFEQNLAFVSTIDAHYPSLVDVLGAYSTSKYLWWWIMLLGDVEAVQAVLEQRALAPATTTAEVVYCAELTFD